MYVVIVLAQNFHTDGTLAGDGIGMVIGMNEFKVLFFCKLDCMLVGIVIGITDQNRLAAPGLHRLHLDIRCGLGHDDRGIDALTGRSQCHALGMIARRSRNHTADFFLPHQLVDAVIGAAAFKREHTLQVFTLHQHAVVQTLAQVERRIQRRLYGNIINVRLKNFFNVFGRHL